MDFVPVYIFTHILGFQNRKADDKIEFTTVKTSDPIEVNLNKYSKEILDKYKDIPFKYDKALPVISNQKMNDYIKELAELAEINEQIPISYLRVIYVSTSLCQNIL